MAFQVGSEVIVQDGNLRQLIPFGVTFEDPPGTPIAPPTVLVDVKYLPSPLAPPLLIQAQVLAISSTDVLIQYSASTGGDVDYQLDWFVGKNDIVIPAAVNPGVKVGTLSLLTAAGLTGDDYLLVFKDVTNAAHRVKLSELGLP